MDRNPLGVYTVDKGGRRGGFLFFNQYHHERCLEVGFLGCLSQIWKNFLDHTPWGCIRGGGEGYFWDMVKIIRPG